METARGARTPDCSLCGGGAGKTRRATSANAAGIDRDSLKDKVCEPALCLM
jgi:hypothetical protein